MFSRCIDWLEGRWFAARERLRGRGWWGKVWVAAWWWLAFVPAGTRSPWWGGLWFIDFERNGAWVLPVPFNLILRPPTLVWWWVKRPFADALVERERRIAPGQLAMVMAERDHADAVLNAAKQHIAKLETLRIEDNKAFGCELRDPNGTIWQEAKRLQAEIASLTAERDALLEAANGALAHIRSVSRSLVIEPRSVWGPLDRAVYAASKANRPEPDSTPTPNSPTS